MVDFIRNDGDRIARGLEPLDDSFSPKGWAGSIAAALWGDDGSRAVAADVLDDHCQMAREQDGMTARHGLYYQYAYGLLLGDRDELGLSEAAAVAAHDWDDVWNEAGRVQAGRDRSPTP